MNKNIFLKTFALASIGFCGLVSPICFGAPVSISLGGNAYETSSQGGVSIVETGVRKWTQPDAIASAFFSVSKSQKDVKLSLKARGDAEYEIVNGNKKFQVKTRGDAFTVVPVGVVDFPVEGYQRIDIRKISKNNGNGTEEISEIILDGVEGEMNFVRDFSFYWGRRGPSVHFTYDPPRGKDIEYFYNEVFVPNGSDKLASYFMACGFGEGYFGFQVNSPTERRILFSVWSPFDTQNPKDIPEEFKIKAERRGEGVHIGEFGNEGSGGQSFLRYPWNAGTAYKFLARVRPLKDGSTEYTGYFFATDENEWKLIASFKRPKTQTWLNRPHSFLENFSPVMGWQTRNVFFSNQWARDKNGEWHELTNGRFTCDGTGARKVRIDYAGGISPDGKSFELKNCGFFNGMVPSGSHFTRKAGMVPPEIDFTALDALGK